MEALAADQLAFVHVPRTGGTAIRHALRLGYGSAQELHAPARELRARAKADTWARKFSFAFVRNPWTRALSLYQRLAPASRRSSGDFRIWATTELPAASRTELVLRPQAYFIYQAGRPIVSWIGRYEQLQRSWVEELQPYLQEMTPHDVPRVLPHVNQSRAVGQLDWYDDRTIQAVGQLYYVDVALFQYEPPIEGGGRR